MGYGYKLKCTKCSYDKHLSLGYGGFMHDRIYSEFITDALSGKYGDKFKEFLEENLEGIIDISSVLLQCVTCGEINSKKRMDMYLPREPIGSAIKNHEHMVAHRIPKFFNFENKFIFYAPSDIDKKNYLLYAPKQHHCEKCNSIMKIVPRSEVDSLVCPRCSQTLEVMPYIWD